MNERKKGQVSEGNYPVRYLNKHPFATHFSLGFKRKLWILKERHGQSFGMLPL